MSNNVIFKIFAIDKFSKVAEKVARKTKGMGDKFKGLNRETNKLNKNFRQLSEKGSSGFKRLAAAAVGFLSVQKLITSGAEFQDSIADLAAITGAAGKDLEFLRNETLRLAKASAIAETQVAGAFKIIASAKSELLSDPTGLSRVTEQVLVLANNGIELETAANVVTQSLNQFGAGADQAARFVNVLAAGAQIGASEVAETGTAIVKAGAVAKTVGVGFEELNAAIQVLAKGGIKAEVAGTGLKTALLKLESSGVQALMPSVVGLAGAFDNLAQMNLNTTQMSKLFGLEAVAIGSVLRENSGLIGQWSRKITGTNSAQEQATIRLATFNTKVRQLGISIRTKLIDVFTRLEPKLTDMVVQFTGWLDTLDEEKVNTFTDGIVGMLDLMGKLAKAAMWVADMFTDIGVAIGEVAAAVTTLDFGQFSSGTSDLGRDYANLMARAYDVTPLGLLTNAVGLTDSTPDFTPPSTAPGAKSEIDINLKAPAGTVESVKRNDKVRNPTIGTRLNMVTQ